MNGEKLRLRLLQMVQLTLCFASYYTFLLLQGYGLFFAALSGYLLADFIKTLNLNLGFNDDQDHTIN
jgi:hypothetical protein